ncbi:hypothetical protein AVEN_81141-1 [Araneus ventricosus]|uniref:Uncharacterized protein n=1 Tax=Araneus ventricosus TaxID=182803 RepID=A0A4Y2HRG5_ARAVE|nr:hypothetical protein AVEN_81141-1 [Araneus ventricosus]
MSLLDWVYSKRCESSRVSEAWAFPTSLDFRVYSGTPGWVGRRYFFSTLTTGKVTSPNPTGGTRIDPFVFRSLYQYVNHQLHSNPDIAVVPLLLARSVLQLTKLFLCLHGNFRYELYRPDSCSADILCLNVQVF